jgi:hypothetical protein
MTDSINNKPNPTNLGRLEGAAPSTAAQGAKSSEASDKLKQTLSDVGSMASSGWGMLKKVVHKVTDMVTNILAPAAYTLVNAAPGIVTKLSHMAEITGDLTTFLAEQGINLLNMSVNTRVPEKGGRIELLISVSGVVLNIAYVGGKFVSLLGHEGVKLGEEAQKLVDAMNAAVAKAKTGSKSQSAAAEDPGA